MLCGPRFRLIQLPDQSETDLFTPRDLGGSQAGPASHEGEHARNHLTRHVQSGRLAPEQATSYAMAKRRLRQGRRCDLRTHIRIVIA